jgi:hypothetical protein
MSFPNLRKRLKNSKQQKNVGYIIEKYARRANKPEFKIPFLKRLTKAPHSCGIIKLDNKVVTDMITEAEIECRLDDSYKEGIEKGIRKVSARCANAKREMAKGCVMQVLLFQ